MAKEYQFPKKESTHGIRVVNAMQKLPVFCHAKTSGFTTMDLACLCSCIFSTDVPVAGYTCIAYAVALVQLFFVRLFPV